jgi:hypothetical protein
MGLRALLFIVTKLGRKYVSTWFTEFLHNKSMESSPSLPAIIDCHGILLWSVCVLSLPAHRIKSSQWCTGRSADH